jgi:hypothetical protein
MAGAYRAKSGTRCRICKLPGSGLPKSPAASSNRLSNLTARASSYCELPGEWLDEVPRTRVIGSQHTPIISTDHAGNVSEPSSHRGCRLPIIAGTWFITVLRRQSWPASTWRAAALRSHTALRSHLRCSVRACKRFWLPLGAPGEPPLVSGSGRLPSRATGTTALHAADRPPSTAPGNLPSFRRFNPSDGL